MATEPKQNLNNNIWDFQRRMTGRLFTINLINFWLGRRLAQRGDFLRGVGTQAVGWAVINIGIAVIGGEQARKKLDSLPDPNAVDVQQRESKNLRRILAINAPLNLVYMWGGLRLARRKNGNTFLRGNGWGIVLQGFILLCFDTFHLRRVSQIWQSRR